MSTYLGAITGEDDYDSEELVLEEDISEELQRTPQQSTLNINEILEKKKSKVSQKHPKKKSKKKIVKHRDISYEIKKPVESTAITIESCIPDMTIEEEEIEEQIEEDGRLLSSVSFKPNIRRCLNMLFNDNLVPPTLTILTVKLNTEYTKIKNEYSHLPKW